MRRLVLQESCACSFASHPSQWKKSERRRGLCRLLHFQIWFDRFHSSAGCRGQSTRHSCLHSLSRRNGHPLGNVVIDRTPGPARTSTTCDESLTSSRGGLPDCLDCDCARRTGPQRSDHHSTRRAKVALKRCSALKNQAGADTVGNESLRHGTCDLIGC